VDLEEFLAFGGFGSEGGTAEDEKSRVSSGKESPTKSPKKRGFLNQLENITGLDIDMDGDVGVEGEREVSLFFFVDFFLRETGEPLIISLIFFL